METIVLLNQKRVVFTFNYGYETINGNNVIFRETKAVANLSNQDGIKPSSSSLEKSKCELQIQIGVGYDFDYSNEDKGFVRVRDVGASGVLENLFKKHGERLKLKVDIGKIESTCGQNYYQGFESNGDQEMDVVLLPSIGIYGYEVNEVPINYSPSGNAGYSIFDIIEFWSQEQYLFSGNLTISAVIPKALANVNTSVTDTLSVNKKILKEEIGWDVSIIPKNGVVIKCHKSFLFAHSSVFEAMFQSSMQESRTSTVEIPDMSEASVRALLAYLYYGEIEEAAKCSLICFELLHAGHKYDIGKLEECMKNILLWKENDWYDVDVAMRLFLFSRNLPEGNDLKLKAVQVLKSKFSILETSDSYQELFKKDPKAAMELCKYAFSV